MKRFTFTLAVGIVALTLSGPAAMAWWQLTHGLLGVDSGLNVSPGYHQAPDTWESKHFGWETFGITDEFCWTHILPRTDWAYFQRPWYYSFGAQFQDNNPAEHMRILIQKLLPAHRVMPKWEDFRKGFAGHNAEDQGGVGGKHTHWDLFPCAESFIYLSRWVTHRLLEEAVESVAYVDICYGGNPALAFVEGSGAPVGFPSTPVNYAAMMDTSVGDADTDGLLCLAMKAMRKKQQTIDFDTADLKALIPDSRAVVGQNRVAELSMSWQKLFHFDRATYNQDLITVYGGYVYDFMGIPHYVAPLWSEGPLWRQYYDAAKQAASQVQ